jgi:thioredoxin-like negative regulator of GroEL
LNVWEGLEGPVEGRRFVELWGIEGTVLFDEQGLAERLGIKGVPTNIFVRPDGTVAEVGASTPEDLEAAVRRLLGPEAEIDPRVQAEWHWQQDVEHINEHITLRNDRNLGAESGSGPLS